MAKKKPPANVVTPSDADKFAGYLANWQEVLCLLDWRITVSHIRAKRAVMAEVYKIDLEQRSVTIRLGEDFGVSTPVTDTALNELALHECLHIFLKEFKEFCRDDGNEDDILSVEHRIINVLERRLGRAPE